MKEKLQTAYQEITQHLNQELLPFWEAHGVDEIYGGYLTTFDENGREKEDEDKYIVTQTRMIWGYSAFARKLGHTEYLAKAKQGVEFFIRHFWDETNGGWYWKTTRDGSLLDNGKVVYGQTFAIYALAEYTLASGDAIGKEYACRTFELLQKYCADTRYGGYYENMEADWSISEPGFAAGDLKSLDIHMHTMEAFTTLYECTGEEIHKRKLQEVIGIILDHMVNREAGCGKNQFALDFQVKPAINIRRTWNAERETGEVIEAPTDTTSYGHNVELVWLLHRALEIMDMPMGTYQDIARKLMNHALKYGFDYQRGGVYRDGPQEGAPLVRDKEWWQNCESLIGFLDAYERFGDTKYLEAFWLNWKFDTDYMINHEVGEWRQLLREDGSILVPQIGNPWKAIYHSGRSMMECSLRLKRLLEQE
ncbi:MAG: AGE family epimerase/isomerase [Lachnospiraceae bacterium]|nr:AGE family epimerase/isomerase [Lachnospiraceae bacterium]MDD2957795.1 AGE family epimerase/isomerase [Lachnospiraceae bacterium]